MDRAFDRFINTIRSEYLDGLSSAKIGLVELAIDPSSELDRTQLLDVAKLKMAIDVIEEFARSDRVHYQAKIEEK